MATVEFRNVSFKYPGADCPAIENISFVVNESEFVVVCGESGSGKTTLLRHLKRNLAPYGIKSGEILFNGQEIENIDERISASKVGYVRQDPDNQIVTDSVWHELAFGLESLGFSNAEILRRTAEMAEYFDISAWIGKKVVELSGGQKQLLNLAAVMVMQPEILILDEPTAQLDPVAAVQFIDTLVKINRDLGTTVIISEHRLEELFPVADRVLVMEDAKVVVFDTPHSTGEFLTRQGSKQIVGLPSAMRIYAGLAPEMEIQASCPVTVREGRLWLSKLCSREVAKAHEVYESHEAGPVQVQDTLIKSQVVQTRNQSKLKSQVVVEFKNVFFRYSGKSEDILKGTSIQVRKGDFLALLGANGAGKTTMLRLLTGIRKPYSGKVIINGKIVGLPQNPQAVFTEISVEDELAVSIMENAGKNLQKKEEMISAVEEMLLLMGLDKHRKMNPYDLSGGQQQKLAIAKILMLKPEILLLDEPTKGLDPYFKESLADIFKKLNETGVTIIMVSHDAEFCAQHANRCAMLFDGQIVSEGNVREFFGGNSFYTTAASRISRNLFSNCVTCNQVIDAVREIRQSGTGGWND